MAFLAAIPAAIGAAAGGLSFTSIIGLATSVLGGIGSIMAGQAQAQAMQMQAMSSIIQGNQAAIEYRRQGTQVLQKVLETQSTVAARAAAGGIDPFSGSAAALGEYALSKGTDEFNWAQENARMAILSGQANAAGYRAAASAARTQGFINAAGSILGGIGKVASIGGPSTPSLAPSLQPVTYATNTGFASPLVRA